MSNNNSNSSKDMSENINTNTTKKQNQLLIIVIALCTVLMICFGVIFYQLSQISNTSDKNNTVTVNSTTSATSTVSSNITSSQTSSSVATSTLSTSEPMPVNMQNFKKNVVNNQFLDSSLICGINGIVHYEKINQKESENDILLITKKDLFAANPKPEDKINGDIIDFATLEGYLNNQNAFEATQESDIIGSVKNAFKIDCGGYTSRILQEVTDISYPNMEKSRIGLFWEGQGPQGSLGINIVAKRGDYYVLLKALAPIVGIGTTTQYYNECVTPNFFDSDCYDKKLLKTENVERARAKIKELLSEFAIQ
jgi:hypothetical protein